MINKKLFCMILALKLGYASFMVVNAAAPMPIDPDYDAEFENMLARVGLVRERDAIEEAERAAEMEARRVASAERVLAEERAAKMIAIKKQAEYDRALAKDAAVITNDAKKRIEEANFSEVLLIEILKLLDQIMGNINVQNRNIISSSLNVAKMMEKFQSIGDLQDKKTFLMRLLEYSKSEIGFRTHLNVAKECKDLLVKLKKRHPDDPLIAAQITEINGVIKKYENEIKAVMRRRR